MGTKPDVALSILEELRRHLEDYETCTPGRRSFVERRIREKIEPLYKLEVRLAYSQARFYSSINDREPERVGHQRGRVKVFSCALEDISEGEESKKCFYIDATLNPETLRPYLGPFLRIRLKDVTELAYVSQP